MSHLLGFRFTGSGKTKKNPGRVRGFSGASAGRGSRSYGTLSRSRLTERLAARPRLKTFHLPDFVWRKYPGDDAKLVALPPFQMPWTCENAQVKTDFKASHQLIGREQRPRER